MKNFILIIEDTTELWASMKRSIKATQLNIEIECVATFNEAIKKISKKRPNLIICDYYLPNGKSGLDIWKYCNSNFSGKIPFLLVSGMPANQFLDIVSKQKEYPPFLSKPFTINELKVMIESHIDNDYTLNTKAA